MNGTPKKDSEKRGRQNHDICFLFRFCGEMASVSAKVHARTVIALSGRKRYPGGKKDILAECGHALHMG